MKYIVVTGGVVSGLGKGITISSMGRILKSSGINVTAIKIDPYLNIDAGLMSPFEHGETFVLDDGSETDLDLGNYERFLDITLTGDHNITSGKIYSEIIRKERAGEYLGETVQTVPHATELIQEWIERIAQVPVSDNKSPPSICLVEVGGTVGDIEGMVFLEAFRQFQSKVGRQNIMFVHVSLVVVLGGVEEQKTKPTQHSVKELRSFGIEPDVLVCRCTSMLEDNVREKLSSFCQTPHTLTVHDVTNLYHVPLLLVKQGLHTIIRKRLKLDELGMEEDPDFKTWIAMAFGVDNATITLDIAIVGKYTGHADTYLSVLTAFVHAGIFLNIRCVPRFVDSSDLEHSAQGDPWAGGDEEDLYESAWATVRQAAAVLIPGGFGSRGVEGKIACAQFCRETKKPLLGICLGMQIMVIEYARNVLGLSTANSEEFDAQCKDKVIINMPEVNADATGGTMRLGVRPITITPNSLASRIYSNASNSSYKEIKKEDKLVDERKEGTQVVLERHRHRHECSPLYLEKLQAAGLKFSGTDSSGIRMEIVELTPQHHNFTIEGPDTALEEHPFYLGCQFHPEFISRPNRPSPVYMAFVSAALALQTQCACHPHAAGSVEMRELSTAAKLFQEYENKPMSTSTSNKRVAESVLERKAEWPRQQASAGKSVSKRSSTDAHGKKTTIIETTTTGSDGMRHTEREEFIEHIDCSSESTRCGEARQLKINTDPSCHAASVLVQVLDEEDLGLCECSKLGTM